MGKEIMSRIRLAFEKRGSACFVRHVELPQLFGRIARRAGLKVELTQGMSPHPHIVIGAALPVGVVSLYELAEIWFAAPLSSQEVIEKMNAASPEGFRFFASAEIPHDAKSLGKSYDAAGWWLCPREDAKIESAAEVLQKNFNDEILLSMKICDDGLEFCTRDPAGTGPNAFVKALVASEIISGWPDVCLARLILGNWNAQKEEIVPLI